MTEIIQLRNELFLKNLGTNTLIEIDYRGIFIGILHVDATVLFTRSKLIIFDMVEFNENDPLLTYEGNVKFFKGKYLTEDKNVGNLKTTSFSNNMGRSTEIWNTCELTYADFDVKYKEEDEIESLLYYKKRGIPHLYRKYKKTRNFSIPRRESEILINLQKGI